MNAQQVNISKFNFEQCIKCTICTVYCPVVPINPIFPGPKQAGPDGERHRMKASEYFEPNLKLCLNCKRCEVACPSGVRIGDIIQSARIKYSEHKPLWRDTMLANTDIMGKTSTKFASLVNASLALSPIKKMMDSLLKIDHRRMFPQYSSQTFEKWYKKEAKARQGMFARQISYYHGCYVNYNYPKLGQDLIMILNALGFGVNLLEKEKCCGVALIMNGLIDKAKKNAKHNLSIIKNALSDKNEKVLTTSSTCTYTLRDEYNHLLNMDNSGERDDIEMTTRFIYRLIESGEVKIVFKDDFKKRIAYHTPCHMEKLGWSIYSVSLLRMIPNVDFIMLKSQCCGIAGTYGFKKENYSTSQAIGSSLFRQIEMADVDCVATDCETCKWQIEMSTHAKVMNPIEILAEAIDYERTIAINVVYRI